MFPLDFRLHAPQHRRTPLPHWSSLGGHLSCCKALGFPSWCPSQESSCGARGRWFPPLDRSLRSQKAKVQTHWKDVKKSKKHKNANPFCVSPLSSPHAVPHRVLQVVVNIATPEETNSNHWNWLWQTLDNLCRIPWILPENSFLPIGALRVLQQWHQTGALCANKNMRGIRRVQLGACTT